MSWANVELTVPEGAVALISVLTKENNLLLCLPSPASTAHAHVSSGPLYLMSEMLVLKLSLL